MKILVTGGAGFIGSNFIHFWMSRYPDDKVINFDKLTYAGHRTSLRDIEKNNNYQFLKGDITDTKTVLKAMIEVDYVVHFAAESHVDRSVLHPAEFVRTNVLGTQVLLDCALKSNIKRFHHVSTDEVFGDLEFNSKNKFNETTAYNPHSPYSASKAGSDHLVKAYHRTFGLPVTITNCSNNYGPFQDPEKLIPRFITNLLSGKKVPVYGDGKNVRDWLYVWDHCRAIEAVLLKGKTGETYCVGGQKKLLTNLEMTKLLLKLLDLDESYIEYVKDRPGHDKKYAVDWSKINRELGWRPECDLDSNLAKTVEWYKNNKWWWMPIKKLAESIYLKK